MFLSCHVISQDNVTQDLWVFVDTSPLRLSFFPATFGTHRLYGSGEMFLVCHVTLQNHVIKVSWGFMEGNLSW